MGLIYLIGPTLTHIRSKRFFVVGLVRIVRSAVMRYEVSDERIRAGRVVGRIGERENIFIRADGKAPRSRETPGL